MKLQFILICFLLSSLSMTSQSLFKVVNVNRDEQFSFQDKEDSNANYFRIVLVDDTTRRSIAYPFTFPENIDTVKAIGDLLKFKGDTRLCVFSITNYNPARSQIYLGKHKNYSIQVEALFIINQLIYDKPFNYASYPVLVHVKTGENYSLSGKAIDNAFKAYRQWYRKIHRHGIEYARKGRIMPLDNSKARWY